MIEIILCSGKRVLLAIRHTREACEWNGQNVAKCRNVSRKKLFVIKFLFGVFLFKLFFIGDFLEVFWRFFSSISCSFSNILIWFFCLRFWHFAFDGHFRIIIQFSAWLIDSFMVSVDLECERSWERSLGKFWVSLLYGVIF